ncbi:MAG: transporter [Chloroflexi bacterium]|nr:transporter [Chloroflexota bacterium]
MTRVAIIGVGLHPWGKFPEKPWTQIMVDTAREALADAGVEWTDIQTLIAGSQIWGGRKGTYAGNYFAEVMGETGIPIINVNNACATAGAVMRVAYMTIASGVADLVMAAGVDKSPKGFFPSLPVYHQEPMPSVDTLRWNIGLPNPVFWALECRRRMELYGVTDADLAKTKVVMSKHGVLNPKARYRKIFTEEEVLNSAMVADPLRLYEICATSDGAGAVVLCNLQKAKKYTTKPIIVAASSVASGVYGDPTARIPSLGINPKPGVPIISESYVAAKAAYDQAGIGPEDIDFVELPDNSAWHPLQYLETMGFCKEGESHLLFRKEETLIGGKLPVCPSGGFSSFGEATMAQGFVQVYEIVKQLREEAGARQVKGAKVGIAEVYGAAANNSALILKK